MPCSMPCHARIVMLCSNSHAMLGKLSKPCSNIIKHLHGRRSLLDTHPNITK